MSDNYTDKQVYFKAQNRKRLFMVFFLVVTIVSFVVTIGLSRYDEMSFIEAFHVLVQHLLGHPVEDDLKDYIVWTNLFPRSIGTVFVGGALAVGGAVMQSLMRNPLADPYTTGISSGAGLGATMAIVLGISVIPGLTGNSPLIANAFILSLVPATVMILLSWKKQTTPSELILIGVGVMYFFSAFTTIIMLMADPGDLGSAYMWNLGNMGALDWQNLPLIVSASVVCSLILMMMWSKLNVVASGDKTARSFGEDAFKIRRFGLIVISLMTAVIVCYTGTIGFVGLVAPHVVRLFIGSNMRYLIPGSFMFGAALLLVSDAISKMLILPIGVITSIIGGPMFLMLLIKQRKQENRL